MFTFFEWHTQLTARWIHEAQHCLWTSICLLFLNDIHNTLHDKRWCHYIVYGLYVYFFWMTYTTGWARSAPIAALFMDYMFTFFEWHTQQRDVTAAYITHCLWTICLLFLNDIHNGDELLKYSTLIVYGLYVYFFWMTYTTMRGAKAKRPNCLWTICLLFLNDIHNCSHVSFATK